MREAFIIALTVAGVFATSAAEGQQTFTGRLSESTCGASHRSRQQTTDLTDRACLFACINALAKYVLVDSGGQVLAIANQDAMGLPLYAGRPVRITGERKGDAIVVAKVEAIPAHLHLGHVMTNWRDTPGSRGFLPVAIEEARVAVLHAGLAVNAASLDDIKLHAGHVLHALDPALEPKGPFDKAQGAPGAGYGVRNATIGARQHLDLAARADGATASITTHAVLVSSSLSHVLEWLGEAIAAAQRIHSATDAADARRSAVDLAGWMRQISDEGLQPAQTSMDLILKAEGLLGAPR
jgi:hypothetical protein